MDPLARKHTLNVLITVLSLFAVTRSAAAASVPAPYQIGTWQGFRQAAISYTFDDGCSNQFSIAVPMFNAKGFRMTLFTVTSWVGSWSLVQNAASSGHEIASHTVTHPNFSSITDAQQTNELKNSQSTINANVPGNQCVTLAYPYCVEGKDAIATQYYIGARGCSGQLVPSTPANFLNISSFVCGNLGSIKTAADFNSLANSAAGANSWCVHLIHGIDGDGGYSPLPSTELQASLNYLSTNQSKFWVDTFGNVMRYIRERNGASVVETSSNTDSITLQVTDSLDDSVYNVPITLRRSLPTNWMSASVTQNGASVNSQIVRIGSTNFVMFDVVPDRGGVTLAKLNMAFNLSKPGFSAPATFSFSLNGLAGVRYVLTSSTDLVSWSPIQTNILPGASTNIVLAALETAKFYRAQWAP